MADKNDVENMIAQIQEEAQSAAELISRREQALVSDQSDLSYTEELFGKTNQISINDLMEKAGVTSEEFQTLCDKDPTMIQRIGGGKTCEDLAEAAYEKAHGNPLTGSCLGGVQAIFGKAGQSDSLAIKSPKVQEIRLSKSYQGGSNGGAVGYVALEEGNNFITVTIDNKAYGTKDNLYSPENNDMNALFAGCQPGVVMTVDDIVDDNLRTKKGNTGGGKYGHIAVATDHRIGSNRAWGSDGEQSIFNFPRYGAKAHAFFPKNAMANKEDAENLIALACKRKNKELEEAGYTKPLEPEVTPLEVAPIKIASQSTINSNLITMVAQKGRKRDKIMTGTIPL